MEYVNLDVIKISWWIYLVVYGKLYFGFGKLIIQLYF